MLPFGLDLSDAMIRLVVLDRRRGVWRMPIRAEIPVPEGLIVDGEIKNPGATVELLHQLLQAAGQKLRQAIVALPERHTFLKQLTVPANQANSLTTAIHDEAGLHIPYAWDDVYHDWILLDRGDNPDHHDILFGAAPKSLVDGYLSVLDQAGIQTVKLEIESLAIARACYPPGLTGAQLLLDLGRTRSTVILVHDGAVLFSATIRYAGQELNRFIADTLRITPAQAERAKTIFGLDPARGKGVLRKVLLGQLVVLVEKISEVIEYYREHIPNHPPIDVISITGSGATLRGIDQELGALLKQRVELRPAWVFEQLHLPDRQTLPELPFTYATALGLALENFDVHE